MEKLNLSELTIYWQASGENLVLKSSIEAEIQKRIPSNRKYSREFLFQKSILERHSVGVIFLPTTDSFKYYGHNITIEISLDEFEFKEISTNYSSKPPINTAGHLKAKLLVNDNFNEDQIERLRTIGFHTNEILEVECL
jgi:hypothetical protein